MPSEGRSHMSAAKWIVVLAVVLVFLPSLAWAVTPDSPRLEGRVPDPTPVVSIDQPRGTILDALSAIAKQTGWSLVVTAPESATKRPLTLQVSNRPAGEVLDLVLEAGPPPAAVAGGGLRGAAGAPAGGRGSLGFARTPRRGPAIHGGSEGGSGAVVTVPSAPCSANRSTSAPTRPSTRLSRSAARSRSRATCDVMRWRSEARSRFCPGPASKV